jgi:hypothetical protein
MRRIITLSVLSLSLLGGVAAASPGEREISRDRHELARDNRELARDRAEVSRDRRELRRDEAHYWNRNMRPSPRQERFEYRHGFNFVRGEWRWNGYEWVWAPGHYVRAW